MKKLISLIGLVTLLLLVSGCSSKHQVTINKDYIKEEGTKVYVHEVVNKTNKTYDLDVEDMLRVAFEKKLKSENLLRKTEKKSHISLHIKILEYSEGNAFKRWLVPGWGETLLTIQAKLKVNDKTIGSLKATRSIAAGGGFTIGEWKDVFDDIADDVVTDFQEEYKKQQLNAEVNKPEKTPV